MTFTATGISLCVEQTRATTDNDWEGVAQVAVQVDGEVKLYDVQASEADSYRTATLASSNPFYWQSTAPVTVSAWWPYADGSLAMPDVVVQADQRTEENFQKSDYICALDQEITFGGSTISGWTNEDKNSEAEILTDSYDEGTNTYYVYTPEGLDAWVQAVKGGNLDANCLLYTDINFEGGQ